MVALLRARWVRGEEVLRGWSSPFARAWARVAAALLAPLAGRSQLLLKAWTRLAAVAVRLLIEEEAWRTSRPVSAAAVAQVAPQQAVECSVCCQPIAVAGPASAVVEAVRAAGSSADQVGQSALVAAVRRHLVVADP